MKKLTLAVASASLVFAAASTQAAQPTRGFLIENGNTAANKSASVDLGVGEGYTTGALRLGVKQAEVIFTAEKSDSIESTEGLVKFSLPALQGLAELKHSWAVYGGLSAASYKYQSNQNDSSHFNLITGLAFTANVEQLEFTINPELIINTNNQKDNKNTGYDDKSDTYVNLNLGAYYNVLNTEYGSFKPGAEVLISSRSGAKTGIAAGVRWEFNERINLDVLPLYVNNSKNDDQYSIPGQLRLNASF